jgi:DinB superfamily
MTVLGDSKDWTWVLDRPCPECGLVVSEIPVEQVAPRLRADVLAWAQVLARTDVRARPRQDVWSPLEYAAHVRDVLGVYDARLRLMLAGDDPLYPDWDQDATALQARYGGSDPSELASELVDAGERLADRFAGVAGEQWDLPGRRSDGASFTIASFARYFLHDVEHHLWDVGHRTL